MELNSQIGCPDFSVHGVVSPRFESVSEKNLRRAPKGRSWAVHCVSTVSHRVFFLELKSCSSEKGKKVVDASQK